MRKEQKDFYSPFCPEVYGLPSEEEQKKANKALNDAMDLKYKSMIQVSPCCLCK